MHGTFTQTDPINKLLLDGADLIEKRGHCKGRMYDDKGRMCLMGALNAAQGYASQLQAVQKIAAVLGISPSVWIVQAVVDWNNASERTGQEVIDAMRLAART